MAKCGETSFNRKKSKDHYFTKKFAKPEEINVKHKITTTGMHLLKNKKTGRLQFLTTKEIPKEELKKGRIWKQSHDGRFCSI